MSQASEWTTFNCTPTAEIIHKNYGWAVYGWTKYITNGTNGYPMKENLGIYNTRIFANLRRWRWLRNTPSCAHLTVAPRRRPGLFLAVCILATTLTLYAAAWAIWGWPAAAWTLAAGPLLGLAAAVVKAMQEGT